ncbi:type II toxin-antitoxin system toxin TscT [Staphylococcus haemolyticus]|uniref:type II toxin-antitoxin system toxin TscT n=1 Tax=Staphylococcus haemolyticus TaxID=1283 RepID=UPI0034D537BC
MNWEMKNLLCDLEIVKQKIDDVVTSFIWFDEEYFTHEPNHVLSMEEIKLHGYKYHEMRIKNTQTIDLMLMYMKEFNELINKFHEIEKASSDVNSLATKSDNAE